MATYTSSNQTKELLIDAAGTLVAKLGFSNVSTRAIADRAGQNIGSIHYHFKSKEKLFQAVIRNATKPVRENPLSAIIQAREDKLDSPMGQSLVLRDIIKIKIREIFDPERPFWHRKIIYQVLRAEENLLKILREEVIVPELEALKKFFLLVNPAMDDEDAFIQTMLTMTPIIHHAENSENLLKIMGKPEYSKAYLQKLEDKIVLQTQLVLGLPPDKTG